MPSRKQPANADIKKKMAAPEEDSLPVGWEEDRFNAHTAAGMFWISEGEDEAEKSEGDE